MAASSCLKSISPSLSKTLWARSVSVGLRYQVCAVKRGSVRPSSPHFIGKRMDLAVLRSVEPVHLRGMLCFRQCIEHR
ncbi:Uncharacterised protein [Salmonella enterica subsp. arizonae]|uniref:Uncharacterized protein n=1 Tax=Salmonella enterica subsp. arizonae TaxID=59203 RepID=A0A379SRI5_SALER|nr:Uncharacterised protein [Salmonella enterica subsp. arizonae]